MNWTLICRRAGIAALFLLPAVVLFVQNTGVREIHRTQDPINFSIVDAHPAPGDWPWWRGTDRSNSAFDQRPPGRWSNSEDLAWQAPIPGRGHASPCIWGERVFLSTADTERDTISLISLDAASGRSLWQTELHRGGLMPITPKNSHASSTPACDGQNVFTVSTVKGSLWVTAVDMMGRIAWQRDAGPYHSKWGYGSSPAIYKSLLIVAADNKGARIDRVVGGSYLAALHRKTGEIVWRISRPAGDSCGTPIVARIAGRDQLLMAGKGAVTSYDPLTGESLWVCRWSAERVGNSVAFDDLHVFASARYPNHELLCIRADGQGDVTKTHVVWRESKLTSEVPSPIVFQGRVYTLTDDGILGCLDAGTGLLNWKRRLGGTFSSSPLIAGQNLYCCNEDGNVFVIKIGGRGEVSAEISMGESLFASPVVSRDRLFLRSVKHLNCIAAPGDDVLATQPDQRKRRM